MFFFENNLILYVVSFDVYLYIELLKGIWFV